MTSASAALALTFDGPLPPQPAAPARMDRRLLIVIAVVGFHVLGLWALQAGLLRRAVELVIPVSVLTDLIEPAQPVATPAPPPPLPKPAPMPRAAPQPKPAAQPAPQPVAIATPTPVAEAPTGVIEPQPAAPVAAVAPPAAESAAPPAPPAPPRIELPSSSADYLNNPPPPYPPLSRRLGEQGKVVIRAFIDERGTATRAEIRTSSGYDRLDQAALQTVLKWRYVPGKRGGVTEGMWFNVPINFVLE
jgi:periplasmic protein TonB